MDEASSARPFAAAVVHLDGNAVVMVSGELDLETAPELRQALNTVIASGYQQIVLDVSELSFVDSQGLAALIHAQQQLSGNGRSLVLRSPQPALVNLLQLMGLRDILSVAEIQVEGPLRGPDQPADERAAP